MKGIGKFLERIPSGIVPHVKAMFVSGRVMMHRSTFFNVCEGGPVAPCQYIVDETWPFMLPSRHTRVHLYSSQAMGLMAAVSGAEFMMPSSHPAVREFIVATGKQRALMVDEGFNLEEWALEMQRGNAMGLQLAVPPPPTTAVIEFALDTLQYIGPGGIVYARKLDEDLKTICGPLTQAIGDLVPGTDRCVAAVGMSGLPRALRSAAVHYGGLVGESVARTFGSALIQHSSLWPRGMDVHPQTVESLSAVCRVSGHLNAPVVVRPPMDWVRTVNVARMCGVPALHPPTAALGGTCDELTGE